MGDHCVGRQEPCTDKHLPISCNYHKDCTSAIYNTYYQSTRNTDTALAVLRELALLIVIAVLVVLRSIASFSNIANTTSTDCSTSNGYISSANLTNKSALNICSSTKSTIIINDSFTNTDISN